VVDRGLDRIESREPVPVIVAVIHKEAAGEDVRRRDVHLKTAEVTGGDAFALVLPSRQTADDVYVIKRIEPVVEPSPALCQRTRRFDSRRPFVDHQATLRGHSWNEIGTGKSPPVIAH